MQWWVLCRGGGGRAGQGGQAPRCPRHGQECALRTSSTAANPGRPFYKCAHPTEAEECLRFLWADEWDGGPLGGGGPGPGQVRILLCSAL